LPASPTQAWQEGLSERPPPQKELSQSTPLAFSAGWVAAVFGFAGIAASAAGVAKVLFVAFLTMAVISLLLGRRIRE
jgi:uncharacterized membrane protein YtjA (UPF0391 family)